MKIKKNTLRRAEKLINFIVILVMLLQPVGTPGLLLAIAEGDISAAIVEPVQEPAAINNKPEEESPALAEEGETELIENNNAEEKEEASPAFEEDPASETEEGEIGNETNNLDEDEGDEEEAVDNEAGEAEAEAEQEQGEDPAQDNSSEEVESVVDPEEPVAEIPADEPSAEGETKSEVLDKSFAKVSSVSLSVTPALSVATYADNAYSTEKSQYQRDEIVYIKTIGMFVSRYYRIDIFEPDNTKHNVYSCKKNNTEGTATYALPTSAIVSDQWRVEIKKYELSGDCNAEIEVKDSASDTFTVAAQEQPDPVCGDRLVNQPNEECDDGNTVDGDACNNSCELKEMKKETVRTCNGEGELYLYVDDPFQEIATSFTTDRDQLLIFTGNPPVYSLDIKVDGTTASKTKVFADQWVEIFSVDTVPGALVTVEGSSASGARNVQGYLAQDKDDPIYDISATEVIWDDARTSYMYLTPGEYSYLFFDKYTYNSKNEQANDNKDDRKLNVKISGLSSIVDKTYAAPFPNPAEGAVVENYSITKTGTYAMAVDSEDSVYWVMPKCEPLVPIISVDKTANPTTLPEPGGDATFTFTVTNTGIDPVTITSLEDDIFGTLTGDADCQVGTVLASNESCAFDSFETLTGNAGDIHTNVFTAHAENSEGIDAADDDDATVEFTGVPPTIQVTKTANPTAVPETGGDVTFTFTVQNTSAEEAVIIRSLTDSVYGTLNGDADCQVGTVLAVGETCEFSATNLVIGDATGSAHNNIFTAHAEDDDGTDATDDDDATVGFTDVLPEVTVLKTGSPTTVPETGGDITFTYRVTNDSAETATITVLSDDKFGALSGDADCQVGTVLAVGAFCEFEATFAIPAGDVGGTHVDVFTGTISDNEGNTATDTDDETIIYTDVLPTVTLEKTVDDDSKPEPGGTFNYTLTITNTSAEKVTITSLADDNALSQECLDLIGDVLTPSQQVPCSYSVTLTEAGAYPNTAVVTVEDNEGSEASDDDNESVAVTDVLPTVTLDKTVDDNSKPEPGGTFNYTLTITNTSAEKVTITSLADDNALSQECLDLIGDVLTPSQQVSCSYSVDRTEAGTYPNTAAITVEDNEKNPASDTDDESVEVTDVLPVIEVLKTAGTPSLDVPSASVTFTFTVKNNSVEVVTITSLTDDVFGTLTGDADCQVGTVLAPGASCSFDSAEIVSGTADTLHANIFTAHAEDNEKNDATASDSETVTFNAGRIIVDKITDPSADPQSFSFALAGGPDPAVSQTFSLTDLSAPHDSGLIFPGTYSVIEDVVAGWQTSANCQVEGQTILEQAVAVFASSSPDKIVLAPGQTIRCTFTNTFIPPVLTIEKFNDQWPNIQELGGTVDYTIVVRASNNNVYGAFVKDLLPQGFTFAGITSVKKNGGELAVADPAYASPGTWKLGNLAPGDEVVIKFKAQIGSSQDPGTYKDLAWAQGTDDRQAQVLATSVPAPKPDQGVVTDNFVGTQIELATAPRPEAVVLAERTKTETKTKHKTKKVLGAAILPATGADLTWPLVALIILIVGFNLVMESKKKARKNYAAVNKTLMKIFITALFSMAMIFSAVGTHAAVDPSISVRMEKPKAAMDSNEFRIGFVALDIKGRELTAKCFKIPEEEVPVDFTAKAGGNSGSCLINLPDGTYQFYAVASDPGNPANYGQSETVTVEIKTGTPSVPLNYSRDKDSCTVNFTTADDGLTAGVELYRSTELSFTADDSTYVGTADISPNEGGSLTDPNGDCGNHYYAIRAVSAAGAGSAFIGDEKVTVKHKTRTRTRKVTIHPEVAIGAIPIDEGGAAASGISSAGSVEGVATEEGQGAAGENGMVLGEETEGDNESSASPAEFVRKNRWPLILGILAILAAMYAYWKKRKQESEK